jgi:hypothetical protein
MQSLVRILIACQCTARIAWGKDRRAKLDRSLIKVEQENRMLVVCQRRQGSAIRNRLRLIRRHRSQIS